MSGNDHDLRNVDDSPSLLDRLRRWFKGGDGDSSSKETHTILLNQFYGTLRVAFQTALANGKEGNGELQSVRNEIRELLYGGSQQDWQKAYYIEMQMIQIMSEAQLKTEWDRRLAEAIHIGLPYVASYQDIFLKAEDVTYKQSALQRLLNDLQWHYQQRIRRRHAARELATRVSFLFWVAFIIFGSVLFLQFASHNALEKIARQLSEDAAKKVSVNNILQNSDVANQK